MGWLASLLQSPPRGVGFGPGDPVLQYVVFGSAWEAFNICKGQIHAAEAFMRGMPAGMPPGWRPTLAARLPSPPQEARIPPRTSNTTIAALRTQTGFNHRISSSFER
jgi:hypothetical protein